MQQMAAGEEAGSADTLVPDSLLTVPFNIPGVDIFSNYLSWPSSSRMSSNDKLVSLLYHLSYFEPINYDTSTPQKYHMVDINGDSLPDILYHDYYYTSFGPIYRFAVFLNKGDSDFELQYKCVRDEPNNKPKLFYGDCAGTGGSTYLQMVADGSTRPYTTSPKANDVRMQALYRAAYAHSDEFAGVKKTLQKTTFTDINGDGLTDMLFHNYHYLNSNNNNYWFGIFLNDGNLGFDIIYRCMIGANSSTQRYYGDCAG